MSMNLNYEDLWNDLYEWAMSSGRCSTATMMEEMDPRLGEEPCAGACNDTGVVVPASPSCTFLTGQIKSGEAVVERCDICQRFDSDLDAALSIAKEARVIRCEDGGEHVIINWKENIK